MPVSVSMPNEPQLVAVPTSAERRLRRSALVLAAISAILAIGFFALSRAVIRGRTANIDRRILLGMREPGDLSDPIGPRWFEEACRDMTALGGGTVLVLLCALVTAFFWLAGMRRAAVYVAIAVCGAALLSSGLKLAFERQRPDLVPHGQHVYTSSFPSGHSMLAAAVYLTLGLVASRFVPRRRLKALFLVAAVLVTGAVGFSRVYLGVHWPSDVLAGWAVGAAWALVCWCIAAWLQDYGVLEQDIYHPGDGVT
jgi:undecaprenyl-diphosphatase